MANCSNPGCHNKSKSAHRGRPTYCKDCKKNDPNVKVCDCCNRHYTHTKGKCSGYWCPTCIINDSSGTTVKCHCDSCVRKKEEKPGRGIGKGG